MKSATRLPMSPWQLDLSTPKMPSSNTYDPPKAILVTDGAVARGLDWSTADVFDFETTGLYWWKDRPYCLAALLGDQPYVFADGALSFAIKQMRQAPRVIAYNAKFDLHFAQANPSYFKQEIIDPQVALFLLDENRFSGSGKGGLKAAVKELFGYDMRTFKETLGKIREETGQYKERRCTLCGGKGWRGRDHKPCDGCGGLCKEATPVIRTRMRLIHEVPLEELAQYAGEDVWWTKRVWEWCEGQLARHSVLKRNFYEVQMPELVSLYSAEHRGVRVDRDAALDLRARYLGRIATIDGQLKSLTGILVAGRTATDEEEDSEGEGEDQPSPATEATDGPTEPSGPGAGRLSVNLDSPQQVDWFLYAFLGLARPPFRAKRKNRDGTKSESRWQTDENCLLWLAKYSEHEVPRLLWERRKLAKFVGTYLDNILANLVLVDEDPFQPRGEVWILYPNFNQTAAKTGRLSSSKPLNLQNIPRGSEFRSLFIARPGKQFVIADAKQVELRWLAHFSQEPALLAAYRDPNRDLHQETANDRGLAHLPQGRFIAKTANFAEVYEVFGTTFAMQLFRDTEGELDLKPEQAQEILNGIRESRPLVKRWKKNVVKQLEEHGYVKTVEGRYRRLPGIKSQGWAQKKYAERQGINAIIQGSVGDLFARVLIDDRIRDTLLLQVHDEVVCEIDADLAASFSLHVKDLIEGSTERYQTRVPMLASVAIGTDWSAKA